MKCTCPHCGQSFEQSSSKRTSAPTSTDTASMTTAQVYAFYKRTAPIEDVRFFATRIADQAIRNQAHVLLAEAEQGLPRTETLHRLTRLQESWRTIGRPASAEDRFWTAIRFLGRRTRGAAYRDQRDTVLRHIVDACTRLRATYYRPVPTWCVGDSIDAMIAQLGDEVRDLVRAARAICPRPEL